MTVSQHATTKVHTVAEAIPEAATGLFSPSTSKNTWQRPAKAWKARQARRGRGSPG